MTEPTDAEIEAAWTDATGSSILPYPDDMLAFVRAVLAKWGNPAPVGVEQVGWMWQHDETGRTGFVDCWQVENGWQDGNPRLRLISKLYTTQQPTQAQAGAVPLTDEQIEDLLICGNPTDEEKRLIRMGWDAAHGIKGGQHGTE